MIADLATKRPPAIVEALNSNEWRHASSTKLFTKPTDIFMKVNNGRMTWLKNDNNPSHCIKCLNVYCGQAISLNLQFEFHCKCYFCSTYPQLGLIEPIFSDMDEKTLPLLNVSAVYLNSIIIAEMSKRRASDDSSSNNDEFHEPLPQKLPPRKLAHWLPTHQREVIDALH